MNKIVLASASPRRSDLLRQAGIEFEICVSSCEEYTDEVLADRIVMSLSAQKARDVADRYQSDVTIIGADTVVALDGHIMGKPKDREDAYRMLYSLQGRTHQVYTGVTIVKKKADNTAVTSFANRTDVTFYPMTDMEINAYIDSGEPMDKAGAYGIQGRAAVFIEGINGDYNNVVGLPLAAVYHVLNED